MEVTERFAAQRLSKDQQLENIRPSALKKYLPVAISQENLAVYSINLKACAVHDDKRVFWILFQANFSHGRCD